MGVMPDCPPSWSAMPILMSQRAMKLSRQNGWLCAKTEQWIAAPHMPGGGVRRDLFGWMDLIVLKDNQIVGVQACAMSGRASHFNKLREPAVAEAIAEWIAHGGGAELWAFSKRKVKRGGIAVRWHCDVTLLPRRQD